jgi:carbamoyl-phosphate synthase large subunit
MKKRILLTGLSSAAAISFYNSIPFNYYEFFLGDSDNSAPGLFLVSASHRVKLRHGGDDDFVDDLLNICSELKIDVVVPTNLTELLPIAESLPRFNEIGVKVLCENAETLRICNDKALLMEKCGNATFVPRSAIFNADFNENNWEFPVFLKPRVGSDFEGFGKINSAADLALKPLNPNLIVQEFITGAELSVDVLANENGKIIAAVSRGRLRNNSDIIATAQVFRYERLERYAAEVAEKIGVKYKAKIHFKISESGDPMLVSVKPYFNANVGFAVKSGVNIPLLTLRMILGSSLGDRPLSWKEADITRVKTGHSCEFFETFSDSERKKQEENSQPASQSGNYQATQSSLMYMDFSAMLN